MKIKKLTTADLPELLKLFEYNNPAEMLAENKQGLENGEIDIWGVYENDKLVGELRAKYKSMDNDFAMPNKRVYLYAFRINKEYQNKGLGTSLFESVLKYLTAKGYSEFTVGVDDDNIIARHLYNKLGFTKIIARKQETYQNDTYEYALLLRG